MGSGATKVNSNESGTSPSPGVSCSENNNNVTTAKKSTTRPVRPVQEIQRSTSATSHSSVVQKIHNEPALQTKKSKDISPKTEVISLRPRVLEPIKRENVKSNDEIKELNKELAASESQRLDLQEQIQLLEEKAFSRVPQQNVKSNSPDSLQQTLNAKDQYILKLEREVKTNQEESNKLRIKLKKRIKALTNQLHEIRQEGSISQMELKAEITRQAEKIKALKAGASPSSSPSQDGGQSYPDQDHSKIIVELSNQLSEQTDQISSLEEELSEKKKEISDLKLAISNHFDSKDAPSAPDSNTPSSLLPQTSTDRLHSSRGRRAAKTGVRSHHESKQQSNDHNLQASPTLFENRLTKNTPPPLERQSTALSDSDSDWGESITPSHTHSAPPRSRVKSAVSLARPDNRKGSLITLNGNDDSIMDLVSASPIDQFLEQRTDVGKKSTLRNHLERTRKENQSKSLIGPALAFEKKADPFSDTSCEPTPRHHRKTLHTDSKIRIVKPIVD